MSRPLYNGKLSVNRQNIGNVDIYRDMYGIPHIYGDNITACYYGLGFAQATDRLWQLHLNKMVSYGRVSEMFGEQGLNADIFFRSMGLEDLSKNDIKEISNANYQSLQAFVNGVNDAVKQLKVMPIEFLIIGAKFEEYTVLDVIMDILSQIYGRTSALQMYTGIHDGLFDDTVILNDEELKKQGIYSKFDDKNMADYLGELQSKYKKIPDLQDLMADFDFIKGDQGSNSWVVSGKHTKSGKPLLANDPHLTNSLPCFWYQSELIFGQNDYLVGVGTIGTPYTLLGRTKLISWSVTLSYQDLLDFYNEKIDGNKYFHDNQWKPFVKQQSHTIKIGGKEPRDHNIIVKYTHHGPILDKAFKAFARNKIFDLKNSSLSLAWGGFTKRDYSIESFYSMFSITNLEQLQKKVQLTERPPLSMTFATIDGHIGYAATGRNPIRRNPYNGLFIQDGTNPENDWLGVVRFEERPQVWDPPKGYIVACNNKISSDNIKYHTTAGQAYSSARALNALTQLKEKLDKNEKFDADYMKQMQLNSTDFFIQKSIKNVVQLFEENYKEFLKGSNNTQNILKMIEIIKKWDGNMGKKLVAPSIYAQWEMSFRDSLFSLDFKTLDVARKLTQDTHFDNFFYKNLKQWAQKDLQAKTQNNWCKTVQNSHITQKNCLYNLVISFDRAYQNLVEFFQTENMDLWRWGLLHKKKLHHSPFTKTPLKILFDREYESDGGRGTLSLSAYLDGNFDGYSSANYRAVYDMDPKGKNYWIIDAGVSGDFMSPHYSDQHDLHKEGQFIEMEFGFQNLKKNKKYHLRLEQSTNNNQKQEI